MHRMTKPAAGLFAIAALLAACSQDEEQSGNDTTSENRAEPADIAVEEEGFDSAYGAPEALNEPAVSVRRPSNGRQTAPGIRTTAAPGVAFAYSYAFSLPNDRISAVQEQHASACEELGISRCRITGMDYRIVDDDGTVEASLALRLDPRSARSFGREAAAIVNESEGQLVDAEVRGTDEGAAVGASTREEARLGEDIAALERRLNTPGISDGERQQLNAQIERLRRSQANAEDRREQGEAALASTPMVFHYGTGDAFAGYGDSQLANSWREAGSLFTGTIGFFIIALGFILPWALVAGLGWFAWRKLRPSVAHYDEDETATAGA